MRTHGRTPLHLLLALALLCLPDCSKTDGHGILKPKPPAPPPKLVGGRIVFESERGGTPDLYLLNPADGSVTRVTRDSTAEADPVLSPDSTAIAYMAEVNGRYQIFVVNIDGTNPRDVTNDPVSDNLKPRWSPDGTQLLFTKFSGSAAASQLAPGGRWSPTVLSPRTASDLTVGVYTVHRDGSGLTLVTEADMRSLDWSPDGNRLLLLSSAGMWTTDLHGAYATLVDTTRAGSAEFSPDGTRIAYSYGTPSNAQVYTVPTGGGARTAISQYRYDVCSLPTWSPDGARIAFMAADSGSHFAIYSVRSDGSDLKTMTSSGTNDLYPHWGPKP